MCERAISIRLLQPVIRRFLSLQCWSVVDEWRITCQLDNGELLVNEMIRIRRKIKVERFTEKRRRDQWKINDSFFSKDTFVPKVFFFLPFFSCFIIYIYMIIEEERIFINFLPRLRVIKLRIFPDIDKVRNYFCNRRGSNYREILILKSTLNKQLWWNW